MASKPPASRILRLAGLEPLAIGDDTLFVNVGERTNVTGSRAFARLVLEHHRHPIDDGKGQSVGPAHQHVRVTTVQQRTLAQRAGQDFQQSCIEHALHPPQRQHATEHPCCIGLRQHRRHRQVVHIVAAGRQ